jgi:hypothetical protein
MSDLEPETHAYFQAIEEIFVGLRGAPFLLSPTDWQVASGWHREGIPLELIRRCLEITFARWRERGRRGRISSLRYCAPAVAAAWAEQVELTAPGRRTAVPPLTPARRLEALSAALPAALPARARWGQELARLAALHEPQLIEERLAALDRELLESVLAAQSPDESAALEAEVKTALGALARRIPRDEVEIARERLRRQLLRARLALPVLSLFSPEAEAGEERTET